MGIIIKKRKLSPSGSMARIVEDEDGSRNGEIIDAMGHRCTLSGYGIQLLQGLLLTVIQHQPADKLPVRRSLDFDHHIDTEVVDDEIPSGQRSPLMTLEVAMNGGYVEDNWLTSRVSDIKWQTDCESFIFLNDQGRGERRNARYLGITFTEGTTELTPETYREIATPLSSDSDKLSSLPQELLKMIVDKLQIKDAVRLSQTCKGMNSLIDRWDFWRHRLQKDLNCVSLSSNGESIGSRDVYKETYKLVYWAESGENGPPYEEMETWV